MANQSDLVWRDDDSVSSLAVEGRGRRHNEVVLLWMDEDDSATRRSCCGGTRMTTWRGGGTGTATSWRDGGRAVDGSDCHTFETESFRIRPRAVACCLLRLACWAADWKWPEWLRRCGLGTGGGGQTGRISWAVPLWTYFIIEKFRDLYSVNSD
jgi:hypothetical protein